MSEEQKIVHIKWIHTSDVHGNLFEHNYQTESISNGGLASICAYISELRKENGDNLIVTDGGDCLQGKPITYYYNFIDTQSPHIISEFMNEVGYVCGVPGNHDVEVGSSTFERWMQNCNFPLIGANVIDKRTNKPYLRPYIVLNIKEIKIVILGMVTPMIKYYQPNTLWPNLDFEEIEPCAERWMKYIQRKENPDIVVGLFHSGFEGLFDVEGMCHENVVKNVAEQVKGFDMICYGHDHDPAIHYVKNKNGHEVICLGATCSYGYFTEADIELTISEGRITSKRIFGKVKNIEEDIHASSEITEFLVRKYSKILQPFYQWTMSPLCEMKESIKEEEAYFGSCLFMDYIHKNQIKMVGAEISFATPFSYDIILNKGQLVVKDIFPLLAYEEFVYNISLSGQEIKDMLEESYSRWIHTLNRPDDNLLSICKVSESISIYKKAKRLIKGLLGRGKKTSKWQLMHPTSDMYNAYGIIYQVDVTKSKGGKIIIETMDDGSPFILNKRYQVAVNRRLMYDKGGVLAKGTGLSQEELIQRIVSVSEKALPYFIMQNMKAKGIVTPEISSKWSFVPEEIVSNEIKKERSLLFS